MRWRHGRPVFFILFILFNLFIPLLHAQWTLQESHTTAGLRGVHSVDGRVAWASGAQGTILRTLDSGKNWQRCATPPDAQL